MSAQTETLETPAMTEAAHKSSFFRQSGWMMITAVGGGAMMFLVHIFSKYIPDSEYAVMTTLFGLLNWVTLPAIGLQTTFAQQASAAVTDKQKRQLVGTTRAVTFGIFCIWLVMLLITVIWHADLIARLKIANPASLWIMLVVGLVMLMLPIWQGLLQGRQNFLWLGWAAVFNAMGRVVIGGLIVFLLS